MSRARADNVNTADSRLVLAPVKTSNSPIKGVAYVASNALKQ